MAGVGGAAGLMILLALPAQAQTILRDAEIERAIRELARPVIAASGLSPASIRILMIEDRSRNAFVANASTIALHTGLILEMKRPEMLQAVIAHEVAHIANGHITRRAGNARAARNTMLLGLAAGAIAAGAGADGGAAAGIAAGTASSAQRVFLGHTRAEEASADQSGVRYMARANIDPSAMVEVLELFSGQEALNVGSRDPYALTHPLSRERIRALRGFVASYKEKEATDPQAAYWFNRGRDKLAAYIRNSKYTLRRIKKNDTSDNALVARAVALHKSSRTDEALNSVARLLQRRPKDAYAWELKGWIELESRRFNSAVKSYRQAVALAPREALFLAGYGRALLTLDTRAGNAQALDVLTKARTRDPLNPRLMRDLALAYARAGQTGQAALATAERYAMQGRLKDATPHAKRAEGLLPRGSAGWRRAQDILDAARAQKKRK